MPPCRLAVVGAGPLVGRAHCLLIQEMGDAELVCICQRRADDTELAASLGVPLYTDPEEMVLKEQLDGVVISVPTHMHLPVAEACVRGSQARQEGSLAALLIEKPICHDLKSALRLLEITEAAQVAVLVGHQRRHSRLVQRARDLVTDKGFGPLRGVNMEFSLLKPESYFSDSLQWRRTKGVGGPILINAIHDLDLMRYITGHEITSVYAATSRAARGHEVEDSGAISVTFDHGAVGTLLFTDAAPSPWNYEFTTGENKKYPTVPGGQRDCYHFLGAQRSLGFPSLRSFSYQAVEPGWDSPLTVEGEAVAVEDPLRRQMQHFAQVCRKLEAPVCSGRDAVESLAAVMAVQRSAALGCAVAPGDMLSEQLHEDPHRLLSSPLPRKQASSASMTTVPGFSEGGSVMT